VVDYVVEQ